MLLLNFSYHNFNIDNIKVTKIFTWKYFYYNQVTLLFSLKKMCKLVEIMPDVKCCIVLQIETRQLCSQTDSAHWFV